MLDLFSGVLDDERSELDKEKDFLASEIVTSSPVEWKEKKSLKEYPIWSQGQTGSCVAFSMAKLASIEIERQTDSWVAFSPAFIYQRRKNKAPGMSISYALNIVKKEGTTLEAFMPSQNYSSEEEIDKVPEPEVATGISKNIASIVNAYAYVKKDIESVAQVLEKGHAVGLTIFANRNEYNDTPEVLTDLTYSQAEIRHQVTAVDYFLHPELGKCLWIEDSWGVGHGQGGRRVFTEDFVNKRTQLACYFDHFDFDDKPAPEVVFSKKVEFGEQNGEVIKIQDFLKSQGYFPSNQDSTGYYWYITAKAVLNWQLDNLDISESQLVEWGGRYWGNASIEKANKIINS